MAEIASDIGTEVRRHRESLLDRREQLVELLRVPPEQLGVREEERQSNGAERKAIDRESRAVRWGDESGGPHGPGPRFVDGVGELEVDEADPPVGAHHHVARVEIAEDDASIVRRSYGPVEIIQNGESPSGIVGDGLVIRVWMYQRVTPDYLFLERRPIDLFLDQIPVLPVGTVLVHCRNAVEPG
jgi:hypothetical protein